MEDIEEFIFKLLMDGIERVGVVGRVDDEVEEFCDLRESDLVERELLDTFMNGRQE